MAEGKPKDGNDRNKQVIDLLNIIGKRLIDTEQERDAVKSAMKLLHNRIDDLDGKTDQTERAYLTLQTQINQVEKTENEFRELVEKQQAFMQQAEQTLALTAQIEDSIKAQKQITRRLDKVAQDRSRLDRKLDRIEDSVMQAQDMINAKAMVLLADKEVVSHQPASSVPTERPEIANDTTEKWWIPASAGQAVAVACILFLALSTGWLLNEKPFGTATQTVKNIFSSEQVVAFENGRSDEKNEFENISSTGELMASIAEEINIEADSDLSTEEEMETSIAQAMNDISPAAGAPPIEDDAQGSESAVNNLIAVAFSSDKKTQSQSTRQNKEFDADEFINSQKPKKPITKAIKADPDLAASMRVLEDKAFSGDGKSQHDLAIIYAAGHADVKVDYERAYTFFTYAAYNNIPNAAYNLGVLNHQGLGTKQNIEKALGWYYAAANMGHPDALYNLGIAHIEGIGTGYDPVKAEEFFKMSAEQNVMEAAYNLGLIHENGLLGKSDQEQAIYWYKMAADQNSSEAIEALDQLKSNLGLSDRDIEKIILKHARSIDNTISQPVMQSANIEEIKPRNTSFSSENQKPPSPEQRAMDITKAIQLELMDRGLYPGPATGFSNPQTEDAIYSYQAMNELTRTGNPTEALLVHMRSGIEEMGSRE